MMVVKKEKTHKINAIKVGRLKMVRLK